MLPAPHVAPALIDDLPALRVKLAGFTGVWAKRLETMRIAARREARSVKWYAGAARGDVPLHAAFLALTAREPAEEVEFTAIARRDLAWLAEQYEATLAVGHQDYDTWMYAAPMARRALACDWMWMSLDAAERARYLELFVRDSLRYPYVVLNHRVPAHANNQGMAQALNLVTIGWIFGVRRARDPRARHLLAVGLEHLHQQIALLPPDAYAGEGSTYECGVSAPLTALAAAVLEGVAGDRRADRPLAPCGNSFIEALTLAPRLLPPSGVLPGWDQHGYHLGMPNCVRAYLARRTGDPAWFAPVAHGHGWGTGMSFGWMSDDQVWTMLWMPAPDDCPPAPPFSAPWAVTRIGGTLVESGRLHAFQHWDIVGHLPVRAHCNPNALQLEAWGSLLTVDGNPAADYALIQDPRLQLQWWASEVPSVISWAGGSIASHSCVQIDQAIDLRGPDAGIAPDPHLVGAGRLVREERTPGWQCIAADAAACYSERFTLDHAVRTTALVDDALWVVRDDLADSASHDWTWRLVLRAGAVATPWGFRLTTAEHVVLDGIALDGDAGRLEDIAGFPSLLEKRCHHWLRTRSATARAQFMTLLVPQAARELLADLGGIPDTATTHVVDLDLPSSVVAGELLLELPRTYALAATLDGQALTLPMLGHYHSGEPICMAPFAALPAGAARRARLELTITTGTIAAVGRVALHRARPVAPPQWRRTGDRLEIVVDGRHIAVDLARLVTTCPPVQVFVPTGAEPLAEAAALVDRLHLAPDGDWTGLGGEAGCIAGLDHPDWDVRLAAAAWLARCATTVALPALRRRLAAETADLVADKTYAPRYRVKELCLLALHRLADPTLKPILEGLLVREEFYGVRRLAARALQDLGDAASLPALQRWVHDADQETASAARSALAAITFRG